jgi:hypothetical protein
MLSCKACTLRYLPIIELVDPKIQKNVKEKRKVKYGEISTINLWPYVVLNGSVYTENPGRLHQ